MTATSPDDLLQQLVPGTQLDESLIKLIYSFDFDNKGFSHLAINRLQSIGLDDAEEKYKSWVADYEAGRDKAYAAAAEYSEKQQKVKAVCDNGKSRPLNELEPLDVVSAEELSQMVFDPLRFIVDDLITAGLTIVAGAPKSGKSWLLLDMCASVATGTPFLGRQTLQCDVLYLALEDSLNRLQTRLDKVLDGREAPGNLTLAIRCAGLNNGLLDQLEEYCAENPDAGLIVIDTFQRIRSGGGRSDNMYSVDYKEVGQLKHFADDHKLALVLIHHTRKQRDISDDFMNVSGTLGITGAADTTIVLTKEQDDDTTKLSVTGRDVELQDYQMEFQKQNCRWRIVGTSDEVEERKARKDYDNNPVVLTVKKLLDQNSGIWTGSAKELILDSRHFGTPISGTEQKLGKSLGALADLMYQYDQITYQAIKNGSGAKRHRFQYADNPFDVTDMCVEAVDSVYSR